ncbi:MAG: MFS transporter [Anaerolineae bacterium]
MIHRPFPRLHQFSRNAQLAFLSAGIVWFSVFGVYAVLFNLYLLRLGFSAEFIGLVNACGLLSGSFFSLPAGEFGRRWGTRWSMLLGLALALIGYGGVAVTLLFPPSVRGVWLLVAYLLACLGSLGLYMVNVTPFLMSATSLQERNRAFSILTALPTAAAFLGALVGGVLPRLLAAGIASSLESPASYGLSLLVGASLLVIAILATSVTQELNQPDPAAVIASSPGGPAPLQLMAVMALLLFVRAAGQGALRVFANVYMDDGLGVPTALIGTVSALGQLLGIPAALLTPLMAARLGHVGTYSVAILGMAGCLLPLGLVPRWEVAAFGFVGATALFALASPAITVFEQSLVTAKWRPAMEGTVMTSVNLGRGAMALAGGYLIESAGYGALFLTSSALMAAGAILFWLYFRVPRGELLRQAQAKARSCSS